VVVVHRPGRDVATLPAVRDLAPQVEELLLVHNGVEKGDEGTGIEVARGTVNSITFESNRGTAAAWNAALARARDGGLRYLYLLDQDSIPSANAVASARALMDAPGVAGVVQPARRDLFRLDPFPWNTVASGALLHVDAVDDVGGFDERLFVDEVDHELFARLVAAGHELRQLPAPTIGHQTGSPRPIRFFGRAAVVSGHSAERRRLQGHSAGMLIRRYARQDPARSTRLLLRQTLTAAKDLAAGQRGSARALLSGLASGVTTGRPPATAASRACAYCLGPLLGRFADVPDWRFGTGAPADVYRCASCGALAAGRVPGDEEVASWYDDYYTHGLEPATPRLWSRLWPTPRRRREMLELRRYFTPPGTTGRLLDVGTGAGERLLEFAGEGWDVVGQDLDPKAGHLAKERGIEVLHCQVGELVGREEPFDLIGLTHVLEHAVDPAGLLQACAALLAPDGRLCVISPNARSAGVLLFGRWWFGLEQPRHLAIPTLESLQRLTERLGLVTVHAATAPANAAVILGGSLARPLYERLPEGPRHRIARLAAAFAGQALGRVAFRVDGGRGEEVVWVGRRREP
jgi:SAM-dependent methyltransferase